MKWINDWPVIGIDKIGNGKGQPVLVYKKPNVGKKYPLATPAGSDEFNSDQLGLQWQWQANPKPYWAFPSNGKLRLFSYPLPDSIINYYEVPNLLMQKFPAEEFMVTTKLSFKPGLDGERAGLIIHGTDYAFISLVKKAGGSYISFSICREADKGKAPTVQDGEKVNSPDIYFRVRVTKGAVCEFSYSEDGNIFKAVGEKLIARPGRWVAAKTGLFCTRTVKTNDSGFADIDWFRIEKN
jgi:beta-xylosidase